MNLSWMAVSEWIVESELRRLYNRLKVSSKGIVRTSLAKWNFVTCWIERIELRVEENVFRYEIIFEWVFQLDDLCFVDRDIRFSQLLKKSKSEWGNFNFKKFIRFIVLLLMVMTIFLMLKKLSLYVWFK